jgi:DNA mismatch endonuclease (patch repair protein)
LFLGRAFFIRPMERFLKSKLKNGAFSGVSAQRSRIMSAIRGKGNKSTELILKMALVRAGVKGWVLHPSTICGKPDFYFPNAKVALFVDGCFWHGCSKCGHIPATRSEFWKSKFERNRQRDRKTKTSLCSIGIHPLRIWEHELRTKQSVNRTISRLRRHLPSG